MQSLCYQMVARTSSDIIVSFSSDTGIDYGIEYRSDLDIGEWAVLPIVIHGSGRLETYVDEGAAQFPHRFYRVFER